MRISVEQLEENVWLLRGHEDTEEFGGNYFGTCIIHRQEGEYWVKGLISIKPLSIKELSEKVKEYFKIDKLHYIRKADLTLIKEI